MRHLSATVGLDVRLQYRSRLYAIGVVTAIALGLVARGLFGAEQAGPVLSALYLLGIGGTTYVFSAALVLMERSEGTLLALRTAPLRTATYVGSKVLTLSTFALLESGVIYAAGFWGEPLHLAPMMFGVASLGVIYTLVGLGQVASHDSVTSFLMPGALVVGSLLQLPFLYILGVGPPAVWYAAPTQGVTLLMLASSRGLEPWQWLYAIATTGLVTLAVGVWAVARLRRHVALGGDRGA